MLISFAQSFSGDVERVQSKPKQKFGQIGPQKAGICPKPRSGLQPAES
jgi:hypothetical protein